MPLSIGLIGLGTMGANLARNAARNGVEVSVYNRTQEKTDVFLKEFGGEGKFKGTHSFEELIASLSTPRVIVLMVKAGTAVDDLLQELVPMLTAGDILIDAGNSHYRDTDMRQKFCTASGVQFVGMGVSGGEEGALKGPSMMPGGDEKTLDGLMPMLSSMSADDGAGGKCVANIGPGGSGHFVKMVHNGVEYGVMQLIAEAYHLLKQSGMTNAQLQETFSSWNTGYLQSFLMEITAAIFLKKDEKKGSDLIDEIMDTAGQKGTGKWTVDAAFEYGVSVPTITAAVDARIVSSARTFRLTESQNTPLTTLDVKLPEGFVEKVRTALECSVVNAYAQGWQLISAASEQEKWNINLSTVARIWRGGCIIRSALLPEFQEMFAGNQNASQRVKGRFTGKSQLEWREIIAYGVDRGIPLPAMSASLTYFDGYRTARLPSNLIAAQRDFFGAHGYERLDEPGSFHTNWSL